MDDMHQNQPPPAPSPYLLQSQPTSHGRVLLARGFELYCAMQWGMSGEDIADAFDGEGDERDRTLVRAAAGLIGSVFARGAVITWVRPIGGGEPAKLATSAWELDDFVPRFASSALDPKRPFDATTAPTHWIFVEEEGWDRLIEASVADVARRTAPARERKRVEPGATDPSPDPDSGGGEERLLRLPEVKRRTGMSRTTIYRKMDQGAFPRSIAISENMTAWRESDVADWIAEPR